MALLPFVTSNALPFLLILISAFLVIRSIYRASPLHQLCAIPGPLLPRLTASWLNYHSFIGDECTAVHSLHEKYGSIVRTGPASVDIADGSVLNTIYQEKDGFLKPDFYRNFDMDGHSTIFTSTVPSYRAPRAKAVAALFSTSSIRAAGEVLESAARDFVERVGRDVDRAKRTNGRIDILPIARSFALDAVSSYLLDCKYSALTEDLSPPDLPNGDGHRAMEIGTKMTALGMVDTFVAVGKNWYLPPWMFQIYERTVGALWPDLEANRSIAYVDRFLVNVVDRAAKSQKAVSFPARLLKAGVSHEEARAQCKDLVFAGTDSTAMNLATICYLLVKHPKKYQNLRQEILAEKSAGEDYQSQPYLQAVIKEGLRLSMANPSRIPRLVPARGLRYDQYFIPARTIVSCTPFELHLNEEVFKQSRDFNPERWLHQNSPTDSMKRDLIAFGHGTRQCIARNLAVAELSKAITMLVAEDNLGSLRIVDEQINIREWFNSHVTTHKIEFQVLE